ncbi:MAG: CDP-alcohol phosphatidyltransferase family protein [Oscillospiraceae bacterium]|nr:CDP-alcohol phosphatidyltransferase family protein [Oscillospiraceae bacterium]
MLGVYNYTVILTYIGMLTGFCGVIHTLDGNLHGALVCLMVAGLCDMFDGAVASTRTRTSKEKRFGVQIDSLSDLVCFGVLPAVISYAAAGKTTVSLVLAGLYLLCALIRLAWFNVDEEERQEHENGSRTVYYGLPVTTSALILPALMELGSKLGWPVGGYAPLALLVMATAFLTPFKLRKPQLRGKVVMLLTGIAEFAVLLTRWAI